MNSEFRVPQTAVIVIGYDVAGLFSAYLLEQQGQSVLLVEARDRISGRVLSEPPTPASLLSTWVPAGCGPA
jgi:monoamine oxidase